MTESRTPLSLKRRSRVLITDRDGRRLWTDRIETLEAPPERVAVLLCDVWDKHWCRGAVLRLERMLPRMAAMVGAARDRGALIVHAPSDTMAFYEGTEARRRAQEAPALEPPPDLPRDDPPLPVDAAAGGCDTEGNPAGADRRVWTRQHPVLIIDQGRDVISDAGREVYSVLRTRGVEHVVIAGVHTNMCILNRSFAIKQMVRWGVDVMLCRDLTDAMYDPACLPYVDHDEGTRLVVRHIEAHWCPTVESADLLV